MPNCEIADPGYGTLTVKLDGTKLAMVYNDVLTPLEHWHFETFNALENKDDPTFKGLKLTFRTDADGELSAVSATFEPLVEDVVFRRQAKGQFSDPNFLKK